MTIAVTGATGYLGSHMVLSLLDRGENVVAFASDGALPPKIDGKLPFYQLPLDDTATLTQRLNDYDVTGIIHFASHGTVPASLRDPLSEYHTTLVSTLAVLRAATRSHVKNIVFSSTASVYGIPDRMPINEETAIQSISPFGAAMAMAERIVRDVCLPACISTAILRYFNVAGADPAGRAGETGHARHLIKAAAQIATGVLDEPLKIYGDDYDTPDGTAIRDYIHVADMAEAHAAALDYLEDGGASITLNCGYGEGVSVRDVIASVQRVTGKSLPTRIAPRRPGDPPQLIADNAAIRTALGWSPRYDDIDLIVRHAVAWEARSLEASPQ